MSSKQWTDQPDVCERAEVLFETFCAKAGLQFEVRKANETLFLVTSGCLFGSQTVSVKSAEDAFKLLNQMSAFAGDRDNDAKELATLVIPSYAKLLL